MRDSVAPRSNSWSKACIQPQSGAPLLRCSPSVARSCATGAHASGLTALPVEHEKRCGRPSRRRHTPVETRPPRCGGTGGACRAAGEEGGRGACRPFSNTATAIRITSELQPRSHGPRSPNLLPCVRVPSPGAAGSSGPTSGIGSRRAVLARCASSRARAGIEQARATHPSRAPSCEQTARGI